MIFSYLYVKRLLGVVVVTVAVTISLQQADAAQPSRSGSEFTPRGNASKTRYVL